MIPDSTHLANDFKAFVRDVLKLPLSNAQVRMFEHMGEFNRRPCELCRRTRKSPKNKQMIRVPMRRSPLGWRWAPVCAECKAKSEERRNAVA